MFYTKINVINSAARWFSYKNIRLLLEKQRTKKMCCFNDPNSGADGREIPSEATAILLFRLALSGVRRLNDKVENAVCE